MYYGRRVYKYPYSKICTKKAAHSLDPRCVYTSSSSGLFQKIPHTRAPKVHSPYPPILSLLIGGSALPPHSTTADPQNLARAHSRIECSEFRTSPNRGNTKIMIITRGCCSGTLERAHLPPLRPFVHMASAHRRVLIVVRVCVCVRVRVTPHCLRRRSRRRKMVFSRDRLCAGTLVRARACSGSMGSSSFMNCSQARERI